MGLFSDYRKYKAEAKARWERGELPQEAKDALFLGKFFEILQPLSEKGEVYFRFNSGDLNYGSYYDFADDLMKAVHMKFGNGDFHLDSTAHDDYLRCVTGHLRKVAS